jgi:hypothetical protein
MSFFNDIDQLKEFVPVSREVDSDFTKLPPQIAIAEKQYISGEIGKEFLEELRLAFTDETETEFQTSARKILQRSLANFTVALFVPKHKVQIDSQGVRVTDDNDRKDAKPYDTNEAIKAFERDGWLALEELLEYLEDNDSEFPTWSSSVESTVFSKSFIRTCRELESVTGLRVTRRLFKKIKPHISRHERSTITSITGSEQFDLFLSQYADGSYEYGTREVLPEIQSIIGHGALRDALALLPVEISEEGITVSGNTSNTNMVRSKTAANDTQLNAMKRQMDLIFEESKGSLSRFLHANPDSFPAFASSSAYTQGRTGNGFDNPEGTSVFMM